MIKYLVDFALRNRFLVLSMGVVLLIWGIISFHRLPVEAYPDVADKYVWVITQWPGHAAEEVEQQVTIPIETQMNGVAHRTHLRSLSLAGLSFVTIIFDDESENLLNRQQVLEKLTLVTLPANLSPQIGPDFSPVGQIYFYTLVSTNPSIDVMELKSLQDWVVFKNLMSVPNIAQVSIFGGATREYQVQVDPSKLISYGLSIAQVEQALANNNVNTGGSFIERGQQAYNIRAVGLMTDVEDVGTTVIAAPNGTPVRVRDVAVVTQGPKIRLGKLGKAIHHEDGRVVDVDDVVEGIVQLRKDADPGPTLDALRVKIKYLNERVLPPGVKIIPHLDRGDLVRYTTHTVLHNLGEGIGLVVLILFLFLGNFRSALIVGLTIPFSLLFASILLDLHHIPANLLSLGALDFGMVVDGAVVMAENILRHLVSENEAALSIPQRIRNAAHEVQRPVFYAITIILTAYLPIFTLQQVEGRLFRPMAWTVAFALLGALTFSIVITPVLSTLVFLKTPRERYNPLLGWITAGYRRALTWTVRHRWVMVAVAAGSVSCSFWLLTGQRIGSEFLPHLDEGAIWLRGSSAPSTGVSDGTEIMNQARMMLASFPEVTQVVSQVGRP